MDISQKRCEAFLLSWGFFRIVIDGCKLGSSLLFYINNLSGALTSVVYNDFFVPRSCCFRSTSYNFSIAWNRRWRSDNNFWFNLFFIWNHFALTYKSGEKVSSFFFWLNLWLFFLFLKSSWSCPKISVYWVASRCY